jgi:hypothetical protein
MFMHQAVYPENSWIEKSIEEKEKNINSLIFLETSATPPQHLIDLIEYQQGPWNSNQHTQPIVSHQYM